MGSLGNCPRVLQFCYKCPRASDPEGRLIANPYDCRQQWLRTLGCPLCTSEWFVCVECFNITAHIKNRKALSRHESLYHKKCTNDGHKRKRYEKKGKGRLDKSIETELRHDFQDVPFFDCNTSTIESNYANNNTNDSNEPSNDDTKTTHQQETTTCSIGTKEDIIGDRVDSTSLNFDTEESKFYFTKEAIKHGNGGRYLVKDTFYANTSCQAADIPDDDVDICLQMTLLVHSLSTRQNKLLGKFLDLLFKKINKLEEALLVSKMLYKKINRNQDQQENESISSSNNNTQKP
jgi:hypothetical protein